MSLTSTSRKYGWIFLAAAGLTATLGCREMVVWLDTITRSVSWQDPDDPDDSDPSDEGDDDEKESAEELLQSWDKPDFAVFYSGNQQGYIEPCGCTGLENQNGGLLRRHSAIQALEDRGWNLLKLDSGDQVKRFGKQSLVKMERTLEAMTTVMDYHAIGFGLGDLKIPSTDLSQALLNANHGISPFVCCNVEVVDSSLSHKFRVYETNGKKVGVTMVLGEEYVTELQGIDGVLTESVVSALADVQAKMNHAQCDAKILMAATSTENCRKLARQFPEFDVVITTDCGGEPTRHPEEIETDNRVVPMVQVGAKGMYVGVIGFYFEPDQSRPVIRYRRIALNARFKDSEPIKKIFVAYQNQLKQLWLSGNFADIKPQRHPSGHQFVGSEACADCHGVEYEIWEHGHDGKGGPHKHATASLTDPNERSWVQRHFDPECVSCHMTGWNPQGFFPYETGYLDFSKDEHLFDNGCENCHGPGSSHIEAERDSKDESLLKRLREEMRVTLEEARANACAQCHDLDNSPDFLKEGGFDKYWPTIEH